MISIDFSRALDARLESVVPENLRGRRRTKQRVEFIIKQFVEMVEAEAPERVVSGRQAIRKVFQTDVFGGP